MRVKISGYPTHRWYHNFLYKFGINNDQKVSVRIDNFDTWSMDHTLAYIILPMLKQLKETKQGSPYVYPADVPKELRPTKKELTAYKKTGKTDSKIHDRWDWVMDEMIFAFESKNSDAMIDYFDTAYQERISNGFKLFGKYYEGLWD